MLRQFSLLVVFIIFIKFTAVSSTTSSECARVKPITKNEKFHVVYEWQYINFTWPSYQQYQEAVASKQYVAGNSVILGVKYYNNNFYLAIPKIKPGTPVSLGYIPQHIEISNEIINPLLTPYPSWSMNTGANCDSLQNLQSMEIDETGIMWVIDGRRIDKGTNKCPPKIVLLDLNAGGKVVDSYIVPDDVCSHKNCYMNDLVVDGIDGGYAYVTDSSFEDPGLIIYSRKQNLAWKVRDKTMFAEDAAVNFTTHNITNRNRNNVNGIALAPRKTDQDTDRFLYYTALSAFNMYAVNSSVLRNKQLATSPEVHQFIMKIGNKTAQTAGMIMDTAGFLYYGLLTEDAVVEWDTSEPISYGKIIEKNPDLIPWPDSYAFDQSGYMYLLASNIDRFGASLLSINETNFKLLKLHTGTCGYQY